MGCKVFSDNVSKIHLDDEEKNLKECTKQTIRNERLEWDMKENPLEFRTKWLSDFQMGKREKKSDKFYCRKKYHLKSLKLIRLCCVNTNSRSFSPKCWLVLFVFFGCYWRP